MLLTNYFPSPLSSVTEFTREYTGRWRGNSGAQEKKDGQIALTTLEVCIKVKFTVSVSSETGDRPDSHFLKKE